jgi:hypothetical protein
MGTSFSPKSGQARFTMAVRWNSGVAMCYPLSALRRKPQERNRGDNAITGAPPSWDLICRFAAVEFVLL